MRLGHSFLTLYRTEHVVDTVASWLVHSSPDRVVQVRALAKDTVLCSWARHFTLTVPLSTWVYKWVPANLLGVTLRWTSIPSRGGGSKNTLSHFKLKKTGISSTWLLCRLHHTEHNRQFVRYYQLRGGEAIIQIKRKIEDMIDHRSYTYTHDLSSCEIKPEKKFRPEQDSNP